MASLDSLPQEIITLISAHLDHIDLCAFSRTSKLYEIGSRPHIFAKAHVRLHLPDEEDSSIAEWTALLERRSCFRHVHKLIISDTREHDGTRHECEHLPTNLTSAEYPTFVRFLEKLTALKDFVWRSRRQVPRRVLQVLIDLRGSGTGSRSGGLVRLHLETFRLRSVDADVEGMRYDREIAASPLLYRIMVRCCDNRRGARNCSQEEVLSLVRNGSAKNLREVVMLKSCLHVTLRVAIAQRRAPANATHHHRGQLQSAVSTSPEHELQGSLTHLQLRDFTLKQSHEVITGWFSVTRSSLIQKLNIDASLETKTLIFLSHLDWSSLRVLHMRNPLRRHSRRWTCFTDEFAHLMTKITGLREVQLLHGMTWEVLESATRQNGATLRKLSVPCLMVRKPENLVRLRRSCPRLSELSIAMPRTQGDALEFEIYNAFGECRNLQHLDLFMDCSVSSPAASREPWDERNAVTFPRGGLIVDDNIQQGLGPSLMSCIWHAWTNANIDEGMAASIYSAVADSKPGLALPLFTFDIRLRKEGAITNLSLSDSRRLTHLMDSGEPDSRPMSTDVSGISWHCRRQIVAGIAGCSVTAITEDRKEKQHSIEDHSPRGLDIRPLVLPGS